MFLLKTQHLQKISLFFTTIVVVLMAFIFQYSFPTVFANIFFDTPDTYLVDNGPGTLLSADFDKDGDFDVAVAHSGANVLSVSLNNGDATFAAPTDYTGGSSGSFAGTTCDLNGDTYADVIVASGSNVKVFLNNADGTFASAVTYTSGASSTGVFCENFDNDTDLDLALSNFNSANFSYLENNGDGTFMAKVDYSAGTNPYSVSGGDFNGDTYPDVVVANNGDSDFSVFLNNGDGTFAAAVDYPLAANPTILKAVDLSGDNELDLAIPLANGTVVVFFGDGSGNFSLDDTYSVPSAFGLDVADIDGDGETDIVTTNFGANSFSYLLNDGSGNFSAAVTEPIGKFSSMVAVQDYNGDTRNDLAISHFSSNDFSIITQLPPFEVVSTTPSLHELDVSRDANIVVTFVSDLDGATVTSSTVRLWGSMSGLMTASLSVVDDTVTINPDQDFRPGERVSLTFTAGIQSDISNPLSPYTLHFTASVGSGKGVFANAQNLSVPSLNPTYSVSADFDNDGWIDTATIGGGSPGELEVWLNQDNGSFTVPTTTGLNLNPRGLDWADLNNDGFIDLAVKYQSVSQFSILLNDGSGGFPSRVDYGTPSVSSPGITLADFDGDGDIDLATGDGTNTSVSVFYNNGSGVYSLHETLNDPTDTVAHIVAADFNNDGRMDIAATCSDMNVYLFINDGEGSFAASTLLTSIVPFEIQAVELSGDGNMDLVLNGIGSTLVSFLGDGDGTFGSEQFDTVSGSYGIDYGDIDEDGDQDVLVVANTGGDVELFFNDGTGDIARGINDYGSLISPSGHMSTADFNGDGALDFAVTDTNGGELEVFFNTIASCGNFLIESGEQCDDGNLSDGDGCSMSCQYELQVLSTEPTLHAIDVSRNTAISLQFNKALNTGSVDASSIRVWGSLSGLASGTFAFQNGDQDVVFTPDESFLIGERVQVMITPSVLAVDGSFLTSFLEFRVETLGGNGAFVSGPQTPAIGAEPFDVVAGDFNGDQFLDLATANSSDSTMSVFLGTGGGVFAAEVEYIAGNQPRGITAADIENDGDLDVIVLNSSAATVSVFVNNGSGVFAPKVDYGSGSSANATGVVSADLNGDGYIDLATVLDQGQVDILLNDGAGDFSNQTSYTSFNALDLEAADLDNDGDVDLAVLMQGNSSVAMFFNNGDGTFPEGVPASYYIGTALDDIESADFNADGNQDLLIGDFTASENLLKRLMNNGDGTFTLASQNAYWSVQAATTGDIDADGDLDFLGAVTRSGSDFLRIGVNPGDGNVTIPGFSSYTTQEEPLAIVYGDFNNDGGLDLVTANQGPRNLSIMLNMVVNVAPTVTVPSSITQATDGSGQVTFEVVVSDADTDLTSLAVEYSDDGGSTFYDADIVTVVADLGSVNTGIGQVGNSDAIDTDTGSRTLSLTWDTQSVNNENGPLLGEQNDIQLRVTPNDGLVNGSSQNTTNFSVDNQIPVGLTELVEVMSTSTEVELSWSAVTESNFQTYYLFYSQDQLDVVNQVQELWDATDDPDLTNIATTSTTITDLDPSSEYYIKIFARDIFGNAETVLEILLQTNGTGRRRRVEIIVLDGSEPETPSVIIEDTTIGSGGASTSDANSPDSLSADEIIGDVHGSADGNGINAVMRIEALVQLFAWMEPEQYELLNPAERFQSAYREFFLLKETLLTIGRALQLTNGVMLRMPEFERILDIPQLLKMLVLSTSDCFTEEELRYADIYDIPGDPYWWAIYALLLEDVFDVYELLQMDLEGLNSLDLLQQVVEQRCLL